MKTNTDLPVLEQADLNPQGTWTWFTEKVAVLNK